MKDSIIRISVIMLDIDPAIWRRIEVPATMTLEGLHDATQLLMGWAGYHLHHFQLGELMFGVPDPEDREIKDGRKIKLSNLLVDGERTFQYLYDYGDGWCCVVVLEAVAPRVPGIVYPRVVEGARRGPPEDVGGPWGYAEFLESLADPKHDRHTESLNWCGGSFNAEEFDIGELNRRLATLLAPRGARRKVTKSAAA